MLRELKEFLAVLPQNMDIVLGQLESLAIKIGVKFDYDRNDIMTLIRTHSEELSLGIARWLTDALKSSAGNVTQVLLMILNLFLIPIFFFYLVSENTYWRAAFKKLVPAEHHTRLSQVLEKSISILKSYLQGQVLACAILALLYGLGLQLAGLKFGILIGIITGSLSFIPYVGFSIGMGLGLVVAFSMGQGFGFVALILAIFMIVQSMESFYITPKLVGKNVGLTALESILILIIFGNLFGFAGMLIAIPSGAVIKTLIAES
jgi:predicted PurR-regulated permease PerM